MAIALRSYDSQIAATNGSVVMTKPTGTLSGDVLIFQADWPNTVGGSNGAITTNVTAPSGFTLIDGAYGTQTSHVAYYKICGGSEPSSYTWSWAGGTGRGAFILAAYSGADGTTPINAYSHNTDSAVDATMRSTSLTPSVANCMIVAMFGVANISGAITQPSGYTNVYNIIDGTNAYSSDMSYLLQTSAVAANPSATYASSTNFIKCSVLVALAPASSGTAAGVTLTGTGSISAGSATGSGGGTASGVTLTGTGSVVAGGASGGAGSFQTRVFKNNTGTVYASISGWTVNVYNSATGALVVQKTALTTDAGGRLIITDSLLILGTTYTYEPVHATYGRRLRSAAAA